MGQTSSAEQRRPAAVLVHATDPCPELAFLVAQNLVAANYADRAGVVVLGKAHCPADLTRAAADHGVLFYGSWARGKQDHGFHGWNGSSLHYVVSTNPANDAELVEVASSKGRVRLVCPAHQQHSASGDVDVLQVGVVVNADGGEKYHNTVPLFAGRTLPGPGAVACDASPFAATNSRVNNPVGSAILRRDWEKWLASHTDAAQCFSSGDGQCPFHFTSGHGSNTSTSPLHVAFVGSVPESPTEKRALQQALGDFFVELGCHTAFASASATVVIVVPNEQTVCGTGRDVAKAWLEGMRAPSNITVVAAQIPIGHTRSLLRAACPQVLFAGVHPTDLSVIHALVEQCDIHFHQPERNDPHAFVDQQVVFETAEFSGMRRSALAASLYFEMHSKLAPSFAQLDTAPGLQRKLRPNEGSLKRQAEGPPKRPAAQQ